MYDTYILSVLNNVCKPFLACLSINPLQYTTQLNEGKQPSQNKCISMRVNSSGCKIMMNLTNLNYLNKLNTVWPRISAFILQSTNNRLQKTYSAIQPRNGLLQSKPRGLILITCRVRADHYRNET